MKTQQAYDQWSAQYDTNVNKTRDLEAVALRELLSGVVFNSCLEMGCGTGKNTLWLAGRADVVAVDLSTEMLRLAKAKVKLPNVQFKQADITADWDFLTGDFDLVTFSLMLEHIEDLNEVFRKVAAVLKPGGYVYVGELHPFKQYLGSKARFETGEGVCIVECFNHHISDFLEPAHLHGLDLVVLKEYFDDGNRRGNPRILALLLKKKQL